MDHVLQEPSRITSIVMVLYLAWLQYHIISPICLEMTLAIPWAFLLWHLCLEVQGTYNLDITLLKRASR